jgi:DnaJ-class molecular chaperone
MMTETEARAHRWTSKPCPTCAGIGLHVVTTHTAERIEQCVTCAGTGRVWPSQKPVAVK